MDEIISEVRQTRDQIVSENRGVLHVLCHTIKQGEAAHRERIIDRSQRTEADKEPT